MILFEITSWSLRIYMTTILINQFLNNAIAVCNKKVGCLAFNMFNGAYSAVFIVYKTCFSLNFQHFGSWSKHGLYLLCHVPTFRYRCMQ